MVNYLLNNLSQMPSRHSNSMCASLLLSSISSQISCHPRQNPQDPSSKLSSNFIPYIQLVSKFCRILLSKYLLDLICPLHYQLYSFKSVIWLDYYSGSWTFPPNILSFIFANCNISFRYCYFKDQTTIFLLA